MKTLISIVLALFTSSCAWIATHPAEDAELVELGETAVKDLYDYETKTLSPTTPVGPIQPN